MGAPFEHRCTRFHSQSYGHVPTSGSHRSRDGFAVGSKMNLETTASADSILNQYDAEAMPLTRRLPRRDRRGTFGPAGARRAAKSRIGLRRVFIGTCLMNPRRQGKQKVNNNPARGPVFDEALDPVMAPPQ